MSDRLFGAFSQKSNLLAFLQAHPDLPEKLRAIKINTVLYDPVPGNLDIGPALLQSANPFNWLQRSSDTLVTIPEIVSSCRIGYSSERSVGYGVTLPVYADRGKPITLSFYNGNHCTMLGGVGGYREKGKITSDASLLTPTYELQNLTLAEDLKLLFDAGVRFDYSDTSLIYELPFNQEIIRFIINAQQKYTSGEYEGFIGSLAANVSAQSEVIDRIAQASPSFILGQKIAGQRSLAVLDEGQIRFVGFDDFLSKFMSEGSSQSITYPRCLSLSSEEIQCAVRDLKGEGKLYLRSDHIPASARDTTTAPVARLF